MSRTPTYIRLNMDEIAALGATPDEFAEGAAKGQALLIEDDRAGTVVPDAWMQMAHKVVICGRTLKDRDGPINPTQRRGLGGFG